MSDDGLGSPLRSGESPLESTELTHQSREIGDRPTFDNKTILELQDRLSVDLDRRPRRRHAEQLAPVLADNVEPQRDAVFLGEDIVKDELAAGEASRQALVEGAVALLVERLRSKAVVQKRGVVHRVVTLLVARVPGRDRGTDGGLQLLS